MGKLYTVSKKKRPGADCGSDHQRLIATFRLKLKKAEKITMPARYDLSQIPYEYAVEVTNRFKGLDIVNCLKNYGQRSGYCTGGSEENHPPKKRKARRQSGYLRRPYK